MPAGKNHNATLGVPGTAGIGFVKRFNDGGSPIFERPYVVSGVTKDSAGVPLAGCEVHLFDTYDDRETTQITSDAGGNYTMPASQYLTHYAVAYKPGSPDVAGMTVNTLAGV